MSALSQASIYKTGSTALGHTTDPLPLDLSKKTSSIGSYTRIVDNRVISPTSLMSSFQPAVCSLASQAHDLANSLLTCVRNSTQSGACGSRDYLATSLCGSTCSPVISPCGSRDSQLSSPCGSEPGRSSPFSSCCGGSPISMTWLRNDDSGYVEVTSTPERDSSYWSPMQHLQIKLDGMFDDVLEDITTDVYQDPLWNSPARSTIVHSSSYLYVPASKRARIPEKRQRNPHKLKERKHECQWCGECLATRSNLLVHMRRHTGEKPYECEFCDKRFTQRSSMRTHIRTHTNERPYACTSCPKTFRDYSTFTKHYRIHTGQRPYICKVCEKGFAQSGNLKRHLTTHSNITRH